MDYIKLEEKLKHWYERYQELADENEQQYFIYEKQPPASIDEILKLEEQIGLPLPPSLRDFFLNFSKNFQFKAHLMDSFCSKLPKELSGVFAAGLLVSLEEVLIQEESRKGWTEVCFTDSEDEYDKVWYDKLGFMHVLNGDIIAFDLKDEAEDKRVVYLSHDDGEGHGYLLGSCFESFLETYVSIGLCGPEDWQMLPFTQNAASGILPDCENARTYRKLIGIK